MDLSFDSIKNTVINFGTKTKDFLDKGEQRVLNIINPSSTGIDLQTCSGTTTRTMYTPPQITTSNPVKIRSNTSNNDDVTSNPEADLTINKLTPKDFANNQINLTQIPQTDSTNNQNNQTPDSKTDSTNNQNNLKPDSQKDLANNKNNLTPDLQEDLTDNNLYSNDPIYFDDKDLSLNDDPENLDYMDFFSNSQTSFDYNDLYPNNQENFDYNNIFSNDTMDFNDKDINSDILSNFNAEDYDIYLIPKKWRLCKRTN